MVGIVTTGALGEIRLQRRRRRIMAAIQGPATITGLHHSLLVVGAFLEASPGAGATVADRSGRIGSSSGRTSTCVPCWTLGVGSPDAHVAWPGRWNGTDG